MSQIIEPESDEQLAFVRELFIEYWDWLRFDPCFQNFEEELATLPGAYSRPAGCILLAVDDDGPLGCVALRPLEGDICEMKRLYVRTRARGSGLGRRLAQRIVDEAKVRGYSRMRLDTLPVMGAAIGLYTSLGFVETAPYTQHRAPGAKYLELRLSPNEENS